MNNDKCPGQIIAPRSFPHHTKIFQCWLRHWSGKPYSNKEEYAKIAEKIKRIRFVRKSGFFSNASILTNVPCGGKFQLSLRRSGGTKENSFKIYSLSTATVSPPPITIFALELAIAWAIISFPLSNHLLLCCPSARSTK